MLSFILSKRYVYDVETELYYLKSRCYNPNSHRFLNEDICSFFNLYSYANNNPILFTDDSGYEAIPIPQPTYIDPSIILESLASLTINSIRNVPWIAAIAYILTPTPTTNDEAVWDTIRSTNAYGNLVDALTAAKEKGLLNRHKAIKLTNLHHIVLRNSPSAQPARTILEKVGIDINNGPENLVNVSTQMHWHMHTKTYIESVNAILNVAYGLSNNTEKQRVNVMLALQLIREAINIVDQAL